TARRSFTLLRRPAASNSSPKRKTGSGWPASSAGCCNSSRGGSAMLTWLKQIAARSRAFFRGRQLDRDFDQELESHLTLLAEEHSRRGMTREQALRAARLELGGLAQLREAHREIRGLPLLDAFLRDVHYALRALRKN